MNPPELGMTCTKCLKPIVVLDEVHHEFTGVHVATLHCESAAAHSHSKCSVDAPLELAEVALK